MTCLEHSKCISLVGYRNEITYCGSLEKKKLQTGNKFLIRNFAKKFHIFFDLFLWICKFKSIPFKILLPLLYLHGNICFQIAFPYLIEFKKIATRQFLSIFAMWQLFGTFAKHLFSLFRFKDCSRSPNHFSTYVIIYLLFIFQAGKKFIKLVEMVWWLT